MNRPTAFAIVLIMLCWACSVQAGDIQFLTHNTKDKVFQDENGELRGKLHAGRRAFTVELVREMMIFLGVPVRMRDVPFKRGLATVQQQPDHALFNVARNAKREDTVKWVGPLQSDASYFYASRSAPTGIQTLEDAKAVKAICVLNGNVHDTFLTKQGFTNLYRVYSYETCFRMLMEGRVALTPSSSTPPSGTLKAARVSQDEILRTEVMLFKSEGYLAFSRNVPDSIIEQWQNALDELKATSRYDQLVEMYLLPADN